MSWTYEAHGVAAHDAHTVRLRIAVPPTGVTIELDARLDLRPPDDANEQRVALEALRELVAGRALQATLLAPSAPGAPPIAHLAWMDTSVPEKPTFVDVAGRMIELGHAHEPG